MKTFSISEALTVGWDKFKSSWKFVIGAGLIITIIQYIPTFVDLASGNDAYSNMTTLSELLSLILILPIMWLTINFMKSAFGIYDKHTAEVADIFKWSDKSAVTILKYVGVSIILSVLAGAFFLVGVFLIFGPMILSVLGASVEELSWLGGLNVGAWSLIGVVVIFVGIYLYTRLGFAPFVLIDKEFGVIESIKKSWAITAGSVTKLVLMYLVLGIAMIIGFAFFIVPGVIVLGILMFSSIHVYRRLYAQHHAA